MMATLEELIQEARKLPVEERHQLLIALNEPGTYAWPASLGGSLARNVSTGVDDELRLRRQAWMKANRARYGGQFVVLDGDRLLAVESTFRKAKARAFAASKPDAFVTYLPQSDEAGDMGSWV